MLYHLLAPLARQHIIFNLFNYITFRAAGATVTALLLAFIVGPKIIAKACVSTGSGKSVRARSHESSRQTRTPTMGGLIIILATVVPTLPVGATRQPHVIVTVRRDTVDGLIGFSTTI